MVIAAALMPMRFKESLRRSSLNSLTTDKNHLPQGLRIPCETRTSFRYPDNGHLSGASWPTAKSANITALAWSPSPALERGRSTLLGAERVTGPSDCRFRSSGHRQSISIVAFTGVARINVELVAQNGLSSASHPPPGRLSVLRVLPF
jgi:hypothetical protein